MQLLTDKQERYLAIKYGCSLKNMRFRICVIAPPPAAGGTLGMVRFVKWPELFVSFNPLF